MVAERVVDAAAPASPNGLLRFTTVGSVDDGKSTLVGRLLHDSRGIATDQLTALRDASRRRGRDGLDLALLTDGLRAEREQGITIDVAYRHFATPRRRFVIADTPGHVQYTKNMVTGCSTTDLAVVLVDARQGPTDQTRRHIAIAALLRVPHLVVCVNKMDLVGWDEGVYAAIAEDVRTAAARLGIAAATTIPLSALRGDNLVRPSTAMPWYGGPTLLDHLETVELERDAHEGRVRLPVQWVIRADGPVHRDYRAYAGRLEVGELWPGDEVVVLPNGHATSVRAIDVAGRAIEHAVAGQSIAVQLADDVDLGRGGLIVGAGDVPPAQTEIEALVCWLGAAPLTKGGRYRLRHGTADVRAITLGIGRRLDVAAVAFDGAASSLRTNDIGEARLGLSQPIFADPYRQTRATGAAVLIDEGSNDTVGAVLIRAPGERWP